MKKRVVLLGLILGGLLLGPAASFAATEHDVYDSLSVDIPLTSPLGTETINFTGTAQFDVYFETDEGQAVDDDFNGRDEVDAELVSLSLTGTSSLGLGSVEITLNPSMASDGVIEELVQLTPGTLDVSPFIASPFEEAEMDFDAYYLIVIGGGQPLLNLDPIRMYNKISHKPGAVADIEQFFETPYFYFTPFQLYEAGSLPPISTEFFLGVPEPSSLFLLGAGLAGLTAVRRRRLASGL